MKQTPRRPARTAAACAAWLLAAASVRAAPIAMADDLRVTLPKMGDAELASLGDKLTVDWTNATFLAGLSAVDRATGDGHNFEALKAIADRNGWRPYDGKPRWPFFADHVCVCQTYLDLYDRTHDPAALGPTRQEMDALLAHLPTRPAGERPLWWWADGLFMGPAVLAHLSVITGDRRYLDAMDAEWWRTTALLYEPRQHLFYRDATFLPSTRPATHPATRPWRAVFWSRGNGWVIAGLARVLAFMPADYPTRPRYVALYRELAERLAALQPADGLWPTDLLAQQDGPNGETSGTALDVYGMAWGVNHGLLDRGRFLPVIARGYSGLRRCVLPDGRLGYGQPPGAKPGKAPAGSVTSFGVGAYLLAGSELLPLAADLPAIDRH